MNGGGIRTFLRLPWSDRLLVAEALLRLLAARLAVRFLSFGRIAPQLGTRGCVSPSHDLPDRMDAVHRTAWAVSAAARRAPWRSKCLEQALAAKWMLRSRGAPSTFYIGVEVGTALELGALEAHAWLRSGSVIVCGEEIRDRFTPLIAFGDPVGAHQPSASRPS